MKVRFLALPAVWMLLSGCGVSPALHHHHADSLKKEASTEPPVSADCPFSFPKSGLCASWTWTTNPTLDAGASATLRFWNAKEGSPKGPYVNPGNTIRPFLWMPSMGHGSSPIQVTSQEPGVYLLEDIFFTMPGDWTLNIELKSGSQILERANLPISMMGTEAS